MRWILRVWATLDKGRYSESRYLGSTTSTSSILEKWWRALEARSCSCLAAERRERPHVSFGISRPAPATTNRSSQFHDGE